MLSSGAVDAGGRGDDERPRRGDPARRSTSRGRARSSRGRRGRRSRAGSCSRPSRATPDRLRRLPGAFGSPDRASSVSPICSNATGSSPTRRIRAIAVRNWPASRRTGAGCSAESNGPSASGRTATEPRSASATSSGRWSCSAASHDPHRPDRGSPLVHLEHREGTCPAGSARPGDRAGALVAPEDAALVRLQARHVVLLDGDAPSRRARPRRPRCRPPGS